MEETFSPEIGDHHTDHTLSLNKKLWLTELFNPQSCHNWNSQTLNV